LLQPVWMTVLATSPKMLNNGSLIWDLKRFGTLDTDKASPSLVLLAEKISKRQLLQPDLNKQQQLSCSKSRVIFQQVKRQWMDEVHQSLKLNPNRVAEGPGKLRLVVVCQFKVVARNSLISKVNCLMAEKSEI